MGHDGWVEICQVDKKLLEGVSRRRKQLGKEPGGGKGQCKERHFSERTDTCISLSTWSFLESALALTRLGLGLNTRSGLPDLVFLFTVPLGWP